MYDYGSVATKVSVVNADRNTPGFMRSPPEVPYMYALESAMDELALALGMDPVELRRLNDTMKDPITGRPYSSRSLRQCFDAAAEAFGWRSRLAAPGSMRDGDWLVGWGCATACYPTQIGPCRGSRPSDARRFRPRSARRARDRQRRLYRHRPGRGRAPGPEPRQGDRRSSATAPCRRRRSPAARTPRRVRRPLSSRPATPFAASLFDAARSGDGPLAGQAGVGLCPGRRPRRRGGASRRRSMPSSGSRVSARSRNMRNRSRATCRRTRCRSSIMAAPDDDRRPRGREDRLRLRRAIRRGAGARADAGDPGSARGRRLRRRTHRESPHGAQPAHGRHHLGHQRRAPRGDRDRPANGALRQYQSRRLPHSGERGHSDRST